jgi:hypothetical protein
MRPQVMGCCRMVYRPPLGAWEKERERESESERERESESERERESESERERESESERERESEKEGEREHICFCAKYSYSSGYMVSQLLVYCNHERSF